MKKIKYVLCTLMAILILFSGKPVQATISSSDILLSGPSSVNQGESFNITVSGYGMGTFQVSVSNGSLIGISGAQGSSGSTFVKGTGNVTLTISPSGTKTVTITVTAIDAAGGDPSQEGYIIEAGEYTSKSVSVVAQSSGGSSSTPSRPSTPSSSNSTPVKTFNLNLSSIQVDGAVLSPDFSGDTVDYSVELPKGTTSVTINATAADSEVSIQGVGEHEVHEGNNVIELTTHHSETSTTKTYRIQVYVEEEPKVFLTYNNMELGVYPSFHGSEALEGFENTEVTIQDQQVLGKVNEQGLVLLYMVEESGEKAFYVYKDEVLYKYLPITIAGRTFISLEIPDDMKNMTGLIQQKITIDDVEYDGWVFEDETFSNYSLLYLMDEKGDIHLYQYESTEGVIQLYSGAAALKQESVDEMSNELNMMRIALIAVSVIAIIILGAGFYFYKKKLSLQH